MSQINSTRNGCKDVFHAFMVKNAIYEGELEIPCIAPERAIPSKLISFSKAVSGTDYDAWVHFYEDDALFERLWNKPFKYLTFFRLLCIIGILTDSPHFLQISFLVHMCDERVGFINMFISLTWIFRA